MRRLGYEVMVFPCTTSASISVHGPWQITPTGFPDLEELAGEAHGVLVLAQEVRVGYPAGEDQAAR